ncbi:GlxA family transcriptional regulator [Acidovorax sp.]|jgi:transcriptional regulator GlxA family with amidase domain|uniref:GlxA family transcriptional regulator n=1 Tax=Acidovorax sp. TaxID=1872122 RepID=UPI0025C7308F|nr:GlxA family transcriptional regulator [Acidovorax sp.]MCI5069211.1 GlxA family transcriptional regulator [Acidovorax sp.]
MASRKSNFQAKKDNVGAKPHQGSAQNTGDIGALIGKLDAASRPAAAPRRKTTGTELRVGILLWPQFPLLSLAGLCDGLRHAADVGDQSRQIRCSWTILGIPGQSVAASCGVQVPVQESLSSECDYDYIAVIGGLLPAIPSANPRYREFLQYAASLGKPLIGICTGSFVLAHAGLMEQRRACVHPYHVDDWQQAFPTLPFVTDSHYLFDGDRITCAGGISIVELMAELVRLHCGPDRAAKVVHQMTVNPSAGHTHVARRHALGYGTTDHDKLRQAIVLMEKNIGTPLEIAVIARLVDSSSRQLERVFLAETRCTPSEYYRNARLKYAKWMLTSTDLPVITIAYECGFADASHFIRHFQQLYGMPPGRMRKSLQAGVDETT